MVLERIFPHEWLERKAEVAFFLGWGYSIVSIIMASFIFPADPSLPAIAFTSLLVLPSLSRLFELKKEMLEEENVFSFRKLFLRNKEFVKVYLFLSLGIFLVYSTAAIILPAFQVNRLFETQLGIRGVHGRAINFSILIFWSIFTNNLLVLIVCFLMSLFTGDGGIFMITWNLSVWGTIFGVTARNAAAASGYNPIILFIIIMAVVLPHATLELLSYILASISGGVISKGLKVEGFKSSKFKTLMYYNIALLMIAINILILGGLIETFVLGNIHIYREIIALSYLV
ncbi:MAG: stage II sporulation protein M [Candidatus Aenigmarchaeota archaeon]|nr:stage II sporulation protein M [Candidatus Aenigmarchaeota archaeon]